jgi:hypothetical protein
MFPDKTEGNGISCLRKVYFSWNGEMMEHGFAEGETSDTDLL